MRLCDTSEPAASRQLSTVERIAEISAPGEQHVEKRRQMLLREHGDELLGLLEPRHERRSRETEQHGDEPDGDVDRGADRASRCAP